MYGFQKIQRSRHFVKIKSWFYTCIPSRRRKKAHSSNPIWPVNDLNAGVQPARYWQGQFKSSLRFIMTWARATRRPSRRAQKARKILPRIHVLRAVYITINFFHIHQISLDASRLWPSFARHLGRSPSLNPIIRDYKVRMKIVRRLSRARL